MMLSGITKALGNDLREIVIKIYESGIYKSEIINIFIISLDALNRLTKKYKEIGSVKPFKRTKYLAKKFSGEVLLEHVMKNPSAILEERAFFFSVKHQSVYARIKDERSRHDALKKTFLHEERDEDKRNEFCATTETEKENNIIYIDKSGIKNH